jgi:hypothetical protein
MTDASLPATRFTHIFQNSNQAVVRALSLVRWAVLIVMTVVAGCVLLTAQNVVLTGSVGGRISDQSGAIVPGASVVLRNLATGVETIRFD